MGNDASNKQETTRIREALAPVPVLGILPHYKGLSDEDVFAGIAGQDFKSDLSQILTRLEEQLNGGA